MEEQELYRQWCDEGRDPNFFPHVVTPTEDELTEAREGWGG